MTEIQWIPQTERAFLASLTPPLAVEGQRGRFTKAAEEKIAEARRQGFGFIGDKGHPMNEVKAPKAEKKVSLTKPAPAPAATEQTKTVTLPAQTAAPAPTGDAAVMRAWAREQGIPVGERGRIHPDVKAAYAAAHGGTLPAKTVTVTAPKAAAPKAAKPAAKVEPKPVRTRPQNVAYGRVRRGDLPKYVSEPILAIESCFGCKKRVGYCTHEAPIMPKWAGGETAVFSKADAK